MEQELMDEAVAHRRNKNYEYATALRDLADWVDKNAEVVEMPWRLVVEGYLFAEEGDPKERLAAHARCIGRADKYSMYGMFGLERYFGPGNRVLYRVAANQEETCERKVVGTKTVTREKPKEWETIEEEVEVVEWECPSLLNQ